MSAWPPSSKSSEISSRIRREKSALLELWTEVSQLQERHDLLAHGVEAGAGSGEKTPCRVLGTGGKSLGLDSAGAGPNRAILPVAQRLHYEKTAD